MLLGGHLPPELHAVRIERFESERVSVSKCIERADVADAVQMAQCRIDVCRPTLLDEIALWTGIKAGIHVLLLCPRSNGFLIENRGLQDRATRGQRRLRGQYGEGRHECGMHRRDSNAAKPAPKGPIAKARRGREILLSVGSDN